VRAAGAVVVWVALGGAAVAAMVSRILCGAVGGGTPVGRRHCLRCARLCGRARAAPAATVVAAGVVSLGPAGPAREEGGHGAAQVWVGGVVHRGRIRHRHHLWRDDWGSGRGGGCGCCLGITSGWNRHRGSKGHAYLSGKSIDRYRDGTVYLRDPVLHEILSRLGNCVQHVYMALIRRQH